MRAIVIRFGRLGDMLLLEPLLRHLHGGYGKACVVMGPGPWTGALYAADADVARVMQVTARHRPLALSPQRWRMVGVLRTHRDAAVHVCECEPRALAKIRTMLALAHVDPARCRFLTDAPTCPDEHWIDRLLRGCGEPPLACAAHWRATALPTRAAPRLVLRASDRLDRETWLRARGWRGEPLWLVQPLNKRSAHNGAGDAAAGDDKAWPAQHWADTLGALHAAHPDARIVLCGTRAEAPLLDALAARVRQSTLDVAAGALPLRRLMALTEIADGMLSVDTGPAHVAAAAGCPLVVLFGAQSPAVWRPRSPTGSAVIALGGAPQHTRAADIAPDEVAAALACLPPRK